MQAKECSQVSPGWCGRAQLQIENVLTDGEKVRRRHGVWLRGQRDWLGRRGGSADTSPLCSDNTQRCGLKQGCQPMAGREFWVWG